MIDKLFQLLSMSPTVSIIAGVVLILIALFLFQDVLSELLKNYIKRKYHLFSSEEVSTAMFNAHEYKQTLQSKIPYKATYRDLVMASLHNPEYTP